MRHATTDEIASQAAGIGVRVPGGGGLREAFLPRPYRSRPHPAARLRHRRRSAALHTSSAPLVRVAAMQVAVSMTNLRPSSGRHTAPATLWGSGEGLRSLPNLTFTLPMTCDSSLNRQEA